METLHTLLSQQMIERLGWTLIHFIWQAAAVALLLAVALRLLRRRSANIRYLVSCLALALVVALPLVTLPLIEVSRPVAEAGPILNPPPAEVTPVEMIELADLPFESLDTPPLETPERAIRIPWTQRIVTAIEPALSWLVLGWLLGVFGLSAWHLGGWAQLQRMKRRMVRNVAEPLRAALADLSGRLGVRRTVGLLESALVEVPTVVGWLKPVILLPASAISGLTTEQLQAILAHELAHVRRCDYLVNIAQTVIEILGFYHPAVWWISHRIRDERENCCDDVAVAVCGDSRRYARALTSLEELRHRTPELAIAASGGSLVARIARLLGRPPIDHRRFAWLPGLIALLVLAAILIPAALLIAAPETTAPLPAPYPPQAAIVQPSADETDRQVLLSFTIAEVPSRQSLDRETAIQARSLLAAEAWDGYSVPRLAQLRQPLWRVFTEHLTDPNLSGDTVKAVLDLLVSNGYARVLSTPQLLTTDRRSARIILGDAPPRKPSATSDRDQSFELNLDVTPTIRHAQSVVSLGLDITFPGTFLVLDEEIRTQRDETLTNRHSAEEFHLSLPRIDLPNDCHAFVSQASAAERVDAQGDFHVPVFLVKATLIEPSVAPALAPSASEQATADAARDFVRTDPTIRELMQRIAQIEVELIEARQTFLPQHPEIAQKEQLLEALRRRLDTRRHELHQEFNNSLAPHPPSASAVIQTAKSKPSGLASVTATFEGTDKRQALETVGEMARVSIVYDPNLSGEVYVTLDDVSIETALRVILAGSPYVATRTPDGYAITRRNAQPATAPGQEVDAVAIEARFVLVDRECLDALRRGLPIKGVTAPVDVYALHEIGTVIAEGRMPVLEPNQVELLLKTVRQYAASKMLAAPKVTVLDSESASMSLSDNIEYISGYRESNDKSPEPIPQHASKEVGVRFDATPQIIKDHNDIRLQFDMEITFLLATQKALYQGKHEYDVPTFTTVTVDTEIVIPDGQTALIHAGPIRSFGDTLGNENDPPAPLLTLIKPTRTTVQPPDPASPMPDNRRPGDPGMGGLPPGMPPSHTD